MQQSSVYSTVNNKLPPSQPLSLIRENLDRIQRRTTTTTTTIMHSFIISAPFNNMEYKYLRDGPVFYHLIENVSLFKTKTGTVELYDMAIIDQDNLLSIFGTLSIKTITDRGTYVIGVESSESAFYNSENDIMEGGLPYGTFIDSLVVIKIVGVKRMLSTNRTYHYKPCWYLYQAKVNYSNYKISPF